MIWLIIISIVLIAGVLGFLKILVTKKYLIHQYNLGVGVQYRDFTKEYYHYNKERSIDEETFIDFEMPQILKKINFTYSEIGNEYLYNLFFRENNNLDTQESIIGDCKIICVNNPSLVEWYHLPKEDFYYE